LLKKYIKTFRAFFILYLVFFLHEVWRSVFVGIILTQVKLRPKFNYIIHDLQQLLNCLTEGQNINSLIEHSVDNNIIKSRKKIKSIDNKSSNNILKLNLKKLKTYRI